MSEEKPRILIIDDEKASIQVLSDILRNHYDISMALNRQQAISLAFAENKPDIILLDIQMQDLDGFEFCRRMQENPDTRDIPVIFITASSLEHFEELGLAAGAVDYITKPPRPAVVLARIKVHLELKRKRDILRNLSNKDGLTGIANRRRLEEFLQFEWQRCLRNGEPIALIMADIDYFKLYNDNYGHAAGDQCLRHVASVMEEVVSRQTDLVARYGGEEFICVLTGTDLSGAAGVAEKIRLAIQERSIPHAFNPLAPMITLSLGVAGLNPQRNGTTAQDLLLAADKAMYRAKSSGRNRVAVSGGLDETVMEPRELEIDAGRQRILLVDDEQINIDTLKAMFEGDCVTLSATSGDQALELARQRPRPDIILLDLQMPGMDGYAVCARLKEDPRTRDIPILLMTMTNRDADEAKGLHLGAVDYIRKPFDPSVVQARVKTQLALRRSLCDLDRRNKTLEETLSMRESVERIIRHDLKQPLREILRNSREILATDGIAPEHLEKIRDIEHSGFELLQAVAATIDLWKLELGAFRIDPHPVDLLQIARTVARTLSRLKNHTDKEILIQPDDKSASNGQSFVVQAEELLCCSVLFSLIKNAVEASPPGRPVAVHLERGQENVRLRIVNSGVLPLNIRSRFMEKNPPWVQTEGKGLGAYSARLAVDSMGAQIQVHADDERNLTEIVLDFAL
ncbi:diguanylate cyclase (GGDEF) domain-containing protein [Desulfonatronum thiosulfatophilum]|uniref:diguanylate cyclase n=1 Tax=Desulfonatronum thiosulfatophilum TaxID=617002 RepID=A0A1G6CD88_9BACT|nr:diguanylate cyclase [Desulfonatronum thiosulfatophilum]SDB30712.1 diguanylate cyclase (GGDEF) domain-containing protein [Desulfonatronum thiosulfatophilum]